MHTPRFLNVLPYRCLALPLSFLAATAHAGGFEVPANGTEALGRGGAFTAKADSPLALEYNVAGLAGQRGTRLLFDNNLYFASYTFARAGGDSFGPYAEATASATPPFYAPWFGLSTDFGFFKHFTFAIGAFGPSSIGKRTFSLVAPSGTDGAGNPLTRPGSSRYDIANTDLLIFFPTAAIAFRPHKRIDIGISGQQVTAMLDLASATYVPQSLPRYPASAACTQSPQDPGCDTITRIRVRSFDNFMLQLGALFHPTDNVDLGFNVKSAVNLGMRPIRAQGTVSASEPPYLAGSALGADHMDGEFETWLPWVFRLGVRYAGKKEGRELWDVEANFVYEAWSWLDGTDNKLTLLNPPALVNRGKPLTLNLPHNYRDTLGIRLGGSVHIPTGQSSEVIVRLGALYDSSASSSADQRLDFDTLHKLGGTAGLGLTVRGVTLNLAYAYLHSLSREVTDGQLSAVDGTTGMPLMQNDMLAPAINNGKYSGWTQIASMGLSIQFDELVKGPGWQSRYNR